MQSIIQDGRYAAKLVDAKVFAARSGKDVIAFKWRLELPVAVADTLGSNRKYVEKNSLLTLTKNDGSANDSFIQTFRIWTQGRWNGADLTWFVNNLNYCRTLPTLVSIKANKISWVCDPDWFKRRLAVQISQSKRVTADNPPTPRTLTAEEIANFSKPMPMKIDEIYLHFCYATPQWSNLDREFKWVSTINSLNLGKDQREFNESDCKQVFAAITKNI